MIVGIDFNLRDTRLCILNDSSDIESCNVFEFKNIIAIINDNIFIGDDAYVKYLTENQGTIYNLNYIVEHNGIIFKKRQISIEGVLSILLDYFLKKLINKSYADSLSIVCISIPYEKYYLWHDLFSKAFSSLGVHRFRIVSQPAAFFALKSTNILHNKLSAFVTMQGNAFTKLDSEYEKKPWYKKLFLKKPQNIKKRINMEWSYLVVSICENSANASIVTFGEEVLEIHHTDYSTKISFNIIYHILRDFIVTELNNNSKYKITPNNKTELLLQTIIDDFLRFSHNTQFLEINLPHVLCSDSNYHAFCKTINLNKLDNIMNNKLNSINDLIMELFAFANNNNHSIEYLVFIGLPVKGNYIYKIIENIINQVFIEQKIIYKDNKSLARGALMLSTLLNGGRSTSLWRAPQTVVKMWLMSSKRWP